MLNKVRPKITVPHPARLSHFRGSLQHDLVRIPRITRTITPKPEQPQPRACQGTEKILLEKYVSSENG
jgi:hypothetical protein